MQHRSPGKSRGESTPVNRSIEMREKKTTIDVRQVVARELVRWMTQNTIAQIIEKLKKPRDTVYEDREAFLKH